jgi:hypothetical protein
VDNIYFYFIFLVFWAQMKNFIGKRETREQAQGKEAGENKPNPTWKEVRTPTTYFTQSLGD